MCQPSKKLPWVKSMNAKIDHQNRLQELARKVADGGKVEVPLNNKNKAQFALYIEDAKIERQRRIERERKKAAQKKTGEAQ